MMKIEKLKNFLPHFIAIILFLGIAIAYFSPATEGKVLDRHDINVWRGITQESIDFRKETGEKTLWTNSLFGGMPTYLINSERNPVVHKAHKIFRVFKNDPQAHLFLYLIGFYIAMLIFGLSPWLAVFGSLAFTFSSYFFIIIEAGHVSKAYAIGYMAPIVAGLYYAFTRNALKGSIIMALFLALQLNANHFQITYYTALICLVFGVVWLIYAIKDGKVKDLIKPLIFSGLGAVLALAINITSIYMTYEYGNFSIRSPSELSSNKENKTSGLDKDYATAWSYGLDETFTFLIPNFKGGASGGSLSTDSETYRLFEQAQGKASAKKVIKQLPLYWGTQPMTSGPVYMGAIICFLFVLGLFLLKGPLKWWLVSATILSVLLGWGKNFMPFTEFFLDYFPGYNKFRTVSMTLVIAELTMPLVAILGLKELFSNKVEKKAFNKAMLWSFGITGGLALFFALFSGMYDYHAVSDQGMQEVLAEALQADRQAMFRSDAFRSFLFIAIASILLLYWYVKKVKVKYVIAGLCLLVMADMWPVNKRYINNDDFISKKATNDYLNPSVADAFILKDIDPNFRVINMVVSTFNDATTSIHHKSIGGYHGAKMRRYQELIDAYIGTEMQTTIAKLQGKIGDGNYYNAVSENRILNMLNTKYFIINPESLPIINNKAMGSAWLVNNLQSVENADQELEKLGTIDLQTTAVYDKKFEVLAGNVSNRIDSTASIALEKYLPNYLKYKFTSSSSQVVVFSELYYPKGWDAYLDGQKVDYFRANYVLRAMNIPEGDHIIEWRFAPKSYSIGQAISYISLVILLGLLLWILLSYLKTKEQSKG